MVGAMALIIRSLLSWTDSICRRVLVRGVIGVGSVFILRVLSIIVLFPLPISSRALLLGVKDLVCRVVSLVWEVEAVVWSLPSVVCLVVLVVVRVRWVVSVLSVVSPRVVRIVVLVRFDIRVTNRLHIEGSGLLLALLAGRTLQILHWFGWAQVAQLSLLAVVSTYRLVG